MRIGGIQRLLGQMALIYKLPIITRAGVNDLKAKLLIKTQQFLQCACVKCHQVER